MIRLARAPGMAPVTRIGFLAGTLVLAGCAHVVFTPPPSTTPAAATGPHYEIVDGHDAAAIARLRAAPAPAQPQVSAGTTLEGDEALMRARGFVRIGVGYFPSSDLATTRAAAIRQGVHVRADQILIYAPQAASTTAATTETIAEYYVRLHLPFGASFRDLTPAERQSLGKNGVEIGQVVGGTPASEANLRNGDFVLKFNHTTVHDKAVFQALLQSHMGRRVILTICRNGATFTRLVRLGTLPPEPAH